MMETALLRFHLISLLQVRHNSGQEFAVPQYNRNFHLVHTLRGEGRLRLANKIYKASPGSVIALPPFTLGSFEKSRGVPWEMANMHYQLKLADGSPIDAHYQMPLLFHPKGFPRIKSQLTKALNLSRKDPALALRSGGIILPLLAEYWIQHAPPTPRVPPRDEAMAALANQIESLDKNFDAAALAETVHLSVSQMNRRFRSARGISPKEYWLALRLAKAEEILRRTNQKIAVIAEELGFSDSYFFTKWFSRRVGMPPGEYRKRCQVGPI